MTRRSRGFTLLEVMAAVGILGILCALAAPSLLGALRHRRLDQTLQGVITLVYTARSEALLNRQQVQVDFNGSYLQARANATGKIYARFPIDPTQNIDPTINVVSQNAVMFNYNGILCDNNQNPASSSIVTVTDTVTSEALTLTVTFGGSLSVARSN